MNNIIAWVLSLINPSLDRLISDLTKLDRKLDTFVDKQAAKVVKQDTRIEKAHAACNRKVDRAAAKCRGVVLDASTKAADAERAAKRASRISSRVKALVE